MENASKALLIAGSILIAIILIAVGMKVINSTSGMTNSVDSTMQSTEIANFNNKFISYVGQSKSAAQVRSLLNIVISSNATSSHYVSINGGSAQDMMNNLENKTYTIKITTYSSGYVSNISID